MRAEQWRALPDFEGYEVSDQGRVRSFRCHSGKVLGKPKILKGHEDQDGYLRIAPVDSEGRAQTRLIHRLVLELFLGPAPEGSTCARHFPNRDRQDNKVSNLAWGTAQDNADDMQTHGTTARGNRNGAYTKPSSVQRGAKHGMAKLSEKSVAQIRQALKLADDKRPTCTQLAATFGVSIGTVSQIKNGRIWRHVEVRI